MAEMLLVNPRHRRRRRAHKRVRVTRVRRNPRRGAARVMTPAQSRFFAPRPRSRRRSARRRASTVGRSLRSYTRGLNMGSFLSNNVIPAGVGAAGALGLDLALGYFSHLLPPSLQQGPLQIGVKIAGAVAIGMIAGSLAGKKFGEEAMSGAITVTVYDIIKTLAKKNFTSLPLSGGFGWVSPAYQVGAYVGSDQPFGTPGIGSYVGSDSAYDGIRDPSLGYYDYSY